MKNHVKERSAHSTEENIIHVICVNGIPKEAGL